MTEKGTEDIMVSYGLIGIIIGIVIYKIYERNKPIWILSVIYTFLFGDIEGEFLADDGPEKEVDIDNVKMVLVVRNDLKMGKGKIGAQCGHATLGAYKMSCKKKSAYWIKCLAYWQKYGQPKICLRVDDEESLINMHKQAKKANIPTYLVVDAGRTQIEPGSKTVCGIGPAPAELIDQITGKLKLITKALTLKKKNFQRIYLHFKLTGVSMKC